MSTTHLVRFPPPDEPWSINQVPKTVRARIARDKTKQEWRNAAMLLAKSTLRGIPKPLPPSHIQVWIPFRTAARRDPHNYTGTVVKALVDGLRNAGLWPDDTPDYVTVLDPILTKGGDVVIAITPREDA